MVGEAGSAGRSRRSLSLVLERAAGTVVAAWLCWHLLLVAIFRSDPLLFGRLHERAGSVAGRLVASAIAVALLTHALLAVRRMVLDGPVPARARTRAVVDAAAGFLLAGLSVVATALILEPVIQDVVA